MNKFTNKNRIFSAKEVAILAAMTSLSVLSRILFTWLPFFKPITAITIISGIAFGPVGGFIVGAGSALISNFYFGQGVWTIFQFFAWGIIGLFAGIFGKPLKNCKILLIIYGIFAGIFFSVFMDVFTTLFMEKTFSLERYFTLIIAALPITIEYAVSNVIFLLILTNPIIRKIDRIKTKYGIFGGKS